MPRALQALALTLAVACVTAAASAQAPADPRQVAAEVHAQGGYVSDVDFSGPGGGAQSFPSDGASAAERRAAAQGREGIQGYQRGAADPRPGVEPNQGWSFPSFAGGPGPALSKLLLIITVLGLVILVLVLLITMWPRGSRPATAPQVTHRRTEPVTSDDPLPWNVGDPDELAAQGRFSEAILALLVLSLKRAGWREEQRSVTPREILAQVGLADTRRPPLGGVVGVAERVRFAGAPADEAAFRAAREYHAQLMGAST